MRLPPRLMLSGGLALAVIVALLLAAGEPAREEAVQFEGELCIFAPATPYDPAAGLPMHAPRPVPAEARCPVCGMYPARYPRWAAQIIFKDGAAHFFDSPINLFVFLQQVGRYSRGYAAADVAVSYVRDFENGHWIEAGRAFFVHGSDITGPMRNADLPAFASRRAADAFARRHRGSVLTAADMTPALLASLNRHRH